MSARMSSPVKGYVSQEFKPRRHAGMDIATGGVAALVHASFAGTVERIVTGRKPGNMTDDGYAPDRTGNYVVVRNPDGERQLFNHTRARDGLRVGDRVSVGEVLGRLDLSGQNTGYHLHYEEWTAAGYPRDPRVSFRAFGVTPGAQPLTTEKKGSTVAKKNATAAGVWGYKNPRVSNGKLDAYALLRGIYRMVAEIHREVVK